MKVIKHAVDAKKQTNRRKLSYYVVLQRLAVIILSIAIVLAGYPKASAAAEPDAGKIVASIKKELKSQYPFSQSHQVTSKRRVFGVSVSDMASYAAYEKTTGSGSNKTEYILFVGRAKSKSAAKTAKKSLKAYVKSEAQSMDSYLSSSGKKVFKGAKTGYKGDCVWIVMLKSKSANSDAVAVIKDEI